LVSQSAIIPVQKNSLLSKINLIGLTMKTERKKEEKEENQLFLITFYLEIKNSALSYIQNIEIIHFFSIFNRKKLEFNSPNFV